MEREQLLKAAPLMSGKIREQREEIRENLILGTISEEYSTDTFSAEQICRYINTQTNLSIDTGTVVPVLEDSPKIERVGDSGKNYQVNDQLDIETYNDLLDEIWYEFRQEFSDEVPHFDPYQIDSDVRSAFEDFFEDMYVTIYETNESIASVNQDPIYEYNVERVIDSVTSDYDILNEGIFRDIFIDYLEDPSDNLKKVTGVLYNGLINLDLMNREEEANISDLTVNDGQLFLDTNVLVALLCETDNRYPVVSELVDQCNSHDIDLYYFPESKSELRSLIRGSKREMNEGFGGRPSESDPIESQFVEDWYRQRETISWSDYLAELSNWEMKLEMYNISEYTDSVGYDDSVFRMVQSSLDTLDKTRSRNESDRRSSNNLEHDAKIVAKTIELRSDDTDGLPSPVVITLDNLVSSINEMGKPEIWKNDTTIQARDWLNYLLTFSSVSGNNSPDLGDIILNTTVNIRSKTQIDSLETYVELIAPKAHLEQSDADTLKDYITTVGLKEEVESSLKKGKGGRAEEIVRDALASEEYLEIFEERSEKDEKLKRASSAANEYKEKFEEERARRKEAEKLFTTSSGTTIEINATAISESTSVSNIEEISQELTQLIELLDSNIDGGIDESGAPNPPDEFTSIDEIRGWLNDTVNWIETAESVSSKVEALAPFASELVSNLPN